MPYQAPSAPLFDLDTAINIVLYANTAPPFNHCRSALSSINSHIQPVSPNINQRQHPFTALLHANTCRLQHVCHSFGLFPTSYGDPSGSVVGHHNFTAHLKDPDRRNLQLFFTESNCFIILSGLSCSFFCPRSYHNRSAIRHNCLVKHLWQHFFD